MSCPPLCFRFVAKVEDVYYKLSTTKHNGFPVLDKKDRIIGLIERDTLITLIEKMAWYYPTDDKVPMFGDGIVIHRSSSSESIHNKNSPRAGSTETL